jgi:hypothetical protein
LEAGRGAAGGAARPLERIAAPVERAAFERLWGDLYGASARRRFLA